MIFLLSAHFSKFTFSKISSRNPTRVSNSLDPDQARHIVGPDLDSNCLRRLLVEGKNCHQQTKSKGIVNWTLLNYYVWRKTEK